MSSETTQLEDFIEQIKASLANVAPSLSGKKGLSNFEDLPCFVWIIDGASTKDVLRAGAVAGQARGLYDDTWKVRVVCYGRTLTEALRMRQSVYTKARDVLGGNRLAPGQTEASSDEEETHSAHVMVVTLYVTLPLLEARVPAMPGGEVVDAKLQTVRPVRIGISPDDAVVGDKQLSAPSE